MRQDKLEAAFGELRASVGERLLNLYRSKDSMGNTCDVLYYFWVMQLECPACRNNIDAFSSYVFARNAYPNRRPEVQILCPACGNVFTGQHRSRLVGCPLCGHQFNPLVGPVQGAKADCPHCNTRFRILDSVGGTRPDYRLYAKLVLAASGRKEYLATTEEDLAAYAECSRTLDEELRRQSIGLPSLVLEDGHNTRQAMSYGFRSWRQFFNDRQLLALGWLQEEINRLRDPAVRNALLTLFSGALEFNNMFASYKGEGTGAVRHMFSNHILKPERTPIEANVWGTSRSSGSFSGLFRSRMLRALEYRSNPTEITPGGQRLVCSNPFTGDVRPWPVEGPMYPRAIYLSAGDSSSTDLPSQSIDLVITDPPFFDNVHYSELADFFFAWQQLSTGVCQDTTRHEAEVQDTDADRFSVKLQKVFSECYRVLKDSGIMVFSYHHSRAEGWVALARAVLGAGFAVVNSHPVRSEMSVGTPKSQASEPINFDMLIVCRKQRGAFSPCTVRDALNSARSKLRRLTEEGFALSRNDRRIVAYGQLLTSAFLDPETGEVVLPVEAAEVSSVIDVQLADSCTTSS